MDPKQVTRDPNGAMRCHECGFSYNLGPREVAARAGSGYEAVREALAGIPESRRGIRPSPEVWSVNAYMWHLADAAALVLSRVQLMIEQDRPPLPNQDQDQRVEENRADDQTAEQSLQRLEPSVHQFQAEVRDLSPSAWERVGVHSTAGEVRLQDVAHDMPHELQHHAADIRMIGELVSH